MSDELSKQRRAHFKDNYLLWVTLRHFLSADLIKELCSVVIEDMSDGQIALDDLFETLSAGEGVLAAWVIRPITTKDLFSTNLQDLIRGIVWNNDVSLPHTREVDSVKLSKIEALHAAYALGPIDMDSLRRWRPAMPHPEPLTCLTDAIDKLSASDQSSPESLASLVKTITSVVSKPLDAVVVKHLGDLCGDADRWDTAQVLYKHAETLLACELGCEWKQFAGSLQNLINQSHAASLWFVLGPQHAYSSLSALLHNTNICSNTLSILNSSTDKLQSASESTKGLHFDHDTRAAILFAPQVNDMNNMKSALSAWACEDYVDAGRKFWAVLRRQIAFGSVVESRRTKAFYGRSIIDELRTKVKDHQNEEAFLLGSRLLVESGLCEIVEKTTWSEELVRTYVGGAVVKKIVDRCAVAQGVSVRRTSVALALFGRWLRVLPIDATETAAQILRFIAETARKSERSIYRNLDLGIVGLESLKEIAQSRPEFRCLCSDVVCKAISDGLCSQNLNNMEIALETANEYADAISYELLIEVVKSALVGLKNNNVSWTVARSAVTFLSSEAVRLLYHRNEELATEVTKTLLRYSLDTESEQARIFFLLRDIDPCLIEGKLDKLESVVKDTIKRANQITASDACYHIMALLVEPTIVKEVGIISAINALAAIVRSAVHGEPAISFCDAWHPIILLADKQHQLARDLVIEEQKVVDLVESVFRDVLAVWRAAAKEPLIFRTFSFPPATTPNTTVVHNWTFASISFARSLGQEEELARAMLDASRHPLLENSIAVAKSFQLSSSDRKLFDIEAIKREDKEAFYVSLGKRLVLLKSLSPAAGQQVVEVLLGQCFRLGPNGLDAGVFVAASSLGMQNLSPSHDVDSYRRRLENRRDLRLSLFPLFEELAPSSERTR